MSWCLGVSVGKMLSRAFSIRNPQSAIRNFCLFLLAAIIPLNVPAQTTAVVHLKDGRTEKIVFEAAQFESADNALVRGQASGRRVEFRAPEIWQIEFGAEPLPRGSTEQLWLNDGTRLTGQIAQWNGPQRPIVQSDLFRSLAVWDDAIIGLTRGWPPLPRLPAAAADKDLLCTTDGDQMIGRFLQIDMAAVGFRSDLGTISCPRAKVSALVLAPRKVAKPEETPWVLRFANDDRVWTKSWGIESGRLRCAIGGSNPTVPAGLLRRAVHLDPSVEVFSRIQPQNFTMQPLLDGTRAIIVDHGPGDCALRVGTREYLFGLFLRPECELDYALSDGDEFFLAELGLSTELTEDKDSPAGGFAHRARASFAVGDGPWKTFALDSRAAPVAVALPLAGARRLRIRVEAADDWGCGAHVVLGEPVLTKNKR